MEIERCVIVDIDQGKTVAKLPFMKNPVLRLRPNEKIAIKVYQAQIRKLVKNPTDMTEVRKSEKKLHDLGFVKYVSDLSSDDRKMIEESVVKYFIPWRVVWNLNSISTTCRLVFDASFSPGNGYSSNDVLAKGTNNMNKLVEIFVRWGMHKFAFHTDVQKMYNAVHLDKKHWCYQMYLWNDDFDIDNPKWKIIPTVIYGVKPSGNLAECGLRKTATLMRDKYERVCEIVHKDIYVDDCISGECSLESVTKTTDEMKIVLIRGGFLLKGFTFSGSDPPEHLTEDGISVKVAGMKWFPKGDFLKLNIGTLNFARKQRGRKALNVCGKIPANFTRRDCVGKVSEIFDLLGKANPIIGGLKIDCHELSLRKLEWDDPIPSDLKGVWLRNFELLQDLRDVKFKRCIVPWDAVDLNIETLDTADASNELICVAIHARFRLEGGGYS